MNWMWWLQIGADALLLLIVAVLIFRLRGLGKLSQISDEGDWEEFIREAGEISHEFDRLLNEKRQLIKRTLDGLDQRIAELKGLTQDLDKAGQPSPVPVDQAIESPPPEKEPQARQESRLQSAAKLSPQAMEEFRAQVLDLAEQGQRAAQIAKNTGRPQGEVELILRLNDHEV